MMDIEKFRNLIPFSPGRKYVDARTLFTFSWWIPVLLFLMVGGFSDSVRASVPGTEVRLRSAIAHELNDSLRMVRMFELAFFYQDVLERNESADSVSELAVRIAELSCRPSMLLYAYNRYMEINDLDHYYRKAIGYGEKALQLTRFTTNPVMEWRSCINMVTVYMDRTDYKTALDYANRAFVLANELDMPVLKVESELALGRALEGKNLKIEAFRHFLTAEDQALRLDSIRLLIGCYRNLAAFYNLNKLFDDAVRYKLKQGDLVKKIRPVDSVALMFIQYDLHAIYARMENRFLNEKNFKGVIDFAIRNGHVRLKNYEFAIYRKHLIESDRMDALYRLYRNDYPEELELIRRKDVSMYYRLQAFFKEVEQKPDSAYYYFRLAETLVNRDPNLILQANFYNRFGQYLMRHGRDREAIDKFLKAFRISDSSGYFGKFDYMMAAALPLEDLFSKTGDFRNAFHFSRINRVLADSISTLSKKEQVVMMDINQEAQKRERIALLEKQQIERKVRQGKNERNMLAGGVAFFLILSFVIFRSYRNQKRLNRLLDEQKKKSDELLLNILPHETAEELKRNGSTQAQRFQEVTVMFTDFKDFTLASELHGADELVRTIDFYYSEFDRIIGKYNIEKIKIIGDSYMCAGGIPVPNETNAVDVVSAALELQAFVMAQRRERALSGDLHFDLRIGIHTGPVVAGIVGIRKFAYDIWGDTVNTASRMENSGEIDKVNVSGMTFERIRHRFTCHYRGKVNAKNKGEIDMYYVDPPAGFR